MKKELKVVLYVLDIAIIAFTAEPACPVCSKYNYEEMLLERVIRNELALEQTLKDIKETNTKVVDALRKLQDENDKVNTSIESMERKQILIEATLGDVINTALANVSKSLSHILTESGRAIKEMEGRVERFKGELHAPTILFLAKFTSSITVSSSQDLVFQQVEVNEGEGYDKGTGKFTASVTGLYNFVVHYCTQTNQYVYLDIVHNGKALQRSGHYGVASYYQGSSMQVYVTMSKGDIVWVRAATSCHFSQTDCSNTFAEVLIRA